MYIFLLCSWYGAAMDTSESGAQNHAAGAPAT